MRALSCVYVALQLVCLAAAGSTRLHPFRDTPRAHVSRDGACYPSLGFQPLDANNGPPSVELSEWWCPLESENGFLGFTYGSDACQSLGTLLADFSRMRSQFQSRYVRMYSWCDDDGTYLNNVVRAAYSAGLGVYLTIWFGFDGDDKWIARRNLITSVIESNPLAPYVVRSVDVGSEPLFDWAIAPRALANEIYYYKNHLRPYGVKVSISEMQYGYSVQGNSQMVLDVQEVVHAHQLPFFDADATYGSAALPSVLSSIDWFVKHTYRTRKIVFTQTGWPTNTDVWQPNSPDAVASIASAQAYAQLLDDSCEAFKASAHQGGVGWFWHIWADDMLPGWGLLDWDRNPKWPFSPRTAC